MSILRDKVYLITGARGAIAGSIIRALKDADASLALADHKVPPKEAGNLAITADLTTLKGAQLMVEQTLEHFGQLDGLICTVGGFESGPVAGFTQAAFDRMIDLNFRTLAYSVAAALPHIAESSSGFIGGISAGQAQRGAGPGAALYAASKVAVAVFLKSLDGELKETNTRVGIVYPMGTVDTPTNRQAMPEVDPKTWIDPDEIGAAFVYLASRSPRGRVLEVNVFGPNWASN